MWIAGLRDINTLGQLINRKNIQQIIKQRIVNCISN